MKKIFTKIGIALFAGLFIVFFGTIGIDAMDKRDQLSESIVGRLIFGEQEGPCPSDMVLVEYAQGDFCIDIYEVSAGENCPYKVPSGLTDSKQNIDNPQCELVSLSGRVPWTNLTQNQAQLACKKDGKRLPTNAEWSEAALGTPDPAGDWDENDCQVASNWAGQPGETGSGLNCESYSGAMDMIGNVWEWVDGGVSEGVFNDRPLPKDGFVNSIDPSDGMPSETGALPDELYNEDYFWLKATKSRSIARGGYWNNKEQAGQYAHYIVSTPAEAGGATGFRCVMNPKP